ncbi:hypothetical protein QYE76_018329 [Lolium multiflorum]|uniref:CCHC-type domain-containing protein n=1 Tax=Lolium multiflorum TaxID=4521 RepID=A0AAD8V6D0_LOLMU|nr:hypothetical protein QYE76_018329 [Lolium multiflorum]
MKFGLDQLQELVRSYLNNRYQEETSIARGEEQLDMKTDVKMDVKLDMELDMKISHGRAREEREACARGEEEVQAGPEPGQTGPQTGQPGPWPGQPAANRTPTGGSPSYRTETGNLAVFRSTARLTGPLTGQPGPHPVDRTTNRTGRSTARSTGSQTGPVRVCLDQIYSGHYSPVSFASSLKPPPFEGVNYKRWRARAILWLTTMRCFDATKGKPEGELTPLEEKAFEDADTLLRGAIISVLGENIVDSYLSISTGKDMWDAIEAKFGVSDAGSELYVMEQFYDFKMTNERSIVEQAHEIQSIAKELEQFTCVLPDKFIAGGIIAKLPPSWRNFATSLKHKRQEFSTTDLIGSLDVEEKARAKDTRARGVEGGSSANLVQKKNFQSYKSKNKNKYDGKGKFDGKNKASQSTNFKRKTDKKKGVCHVCGDPDHWAPNCPNRFDKRQQGKGGKTANVVIGDTEMKDAGYGTSSVLMGNGSHATVRGVGTSVKTQAMESKPMERELEMMKMELQRTGRNFRPPGPELPARFLQDAVKMSSSAQRSGASRNFRPEGPELPPARNFRPSSAQVPKVRQNAPGCYCKETGQFRNLTGTWPELPVGPNFRSDRNSP